MTWLFGSDDDRAKHEGKIEPQMWNGYPDGDLTMSATLDLGQCSLRLSSLMACEVP